MQALSIFLTVIGILLLVLSLFPIRKISAKQNRVCKGWKFLGILVILFVFGYAQFIYVAYTSHPSYEKMLFSTILFCGAVFVIVVIFLSKLSIDRIEQLARMERHRASHDGLTDLPNRLQFQERLDFALMTCKRQKTSLAVLSIDLLRFKEINESLGHFYGDYVLQEIASRLEDIFKRETDTLARIGGDEFAVLLPEVSLQDAVKVTQKISSIIDQPFRFEGHDVTIGANIGIAMFPEHGEDSETIMQHADIAMYVAKHNEVVYAVFDPEHNRSTWNRLVLIGQLREAVSKGQFVLHYQPKIAVAEGCFSGVEALARWVHPGKKIIHPDEFIPLVEQAGLSKSFTNWVLDEALQQSGKWETAGKKINISVNLSVKNLHDLEFPKDVRRLLTKYPVDPRRLILEITESCVLIDQKRALKVLRELRELGVTLSLDDYGTGYSSIAYLRKFPVQEIKIDKSFVTNMLGDEDNEAIVKSTIMMAHSIGCKVVAEGVEDEQTLQKLIELGCDYIQGFHISRPIAVSDFDKWLGACRMECTGPTRISREEYHEDCGSACLGKVLQSFPVKPNR